MKVITRTWLAQKMSGCPNPEDDRGLKGLAGCVGMDPALPVCCGNNPDEGPCRKLSNQFILGASNGPILSLQVCGFIMKCYLK